MLSSLNTHVTELACSNRAPIHQPTGFDLATGCFITHTQPLCTVLWRLHQHQQAHALIRLIEASHCLYATTAHPLKDEVDVASHGTLVHVLRYPF